MPDESNKSEEVSGGEGEPPVRRGDEIVAAPKRRMIGKQTHEEKTLRKNCQGRGCMESNRTQNLDRQGETLYIAGI